jgi:hypothetical protein
MQLNARYVGFKYYDATTIAEIKKNVSSLLSTPAGTIPGDRNFGINPEFISSPREIAQNKLALDIVEKLEIYEPRVELRKVTFESDDVSGNLKAVVLLGANEDYDEDDDEEYDYE